jgi:hypothetical protein
MWTAPLNCCRRLPKRRNFGSAVTGADMLRESRERASDPVLTGFSGPGRRFLKRWRARVLSGYTEFMTLPRWWTCVTAFARRSRADRGTDSCRSIMLRLSRRRHNEKGVRSVHDQVSRSGLGPMSLWFIGLFVGFRKLRRILRRIARRNGSKLSSPLLSTPLKTCGLRRLAFGCQPKGCRFESYRVHQFKPNPISRTPLPK